MFTGCSEYHEEMEILVKLSQLLLIKIEKRQIKFIAVLPNATTMQAAMKPLTQTVVS